MKFEIYVNCSRDAIQLLLKSFANQQEKETVFRKLEFRKKSSCLIFDEQDIIGYSLGYEYDGKSKIQLFLNKIMNNSELERLAEEINDIYILPADKSFFIIEEAESSIPILDKFKAIDSNITFLLNKPLRLKEFECPFQFSLEQFDVSEYAELMKECFRDDKEWDYSNYLEQAEDFLEDDCVTWVCRNDGNLIGACSICDSDDKIYIDLLCTKPAYQRSGIGSKLIEKSLENRAGKPVYLDVKSKNKNAIHFYKNLGFKKMSTGYIVVRKLELISSVFSLSSAF